MVPYCSLRIGGLGKQSVEAFRDFASTPKAPDSLSVAQNLIDVTFFRRVQGYCYCRSLFNAGEVSGSFDVRAVVLVYDAATIHC